MHQLRIYMGAKLREHRNMLGLTQEEVAHAARTTASHLGKIERGENNMTVDSLERILQAMHAHPQDVFK